MSTITKTGVKQTREYLSKKFDDLMRPTGQDFADFIASYPNFLDEDIVASEGKLGVNLGTVSDNEQNLPAHRLDIALGDITDADTGRCEMGRIGNFVAYDTPDTFNLGHHSLVDDDPTSTPSVDNYAIRQDDAGVLTFNAQQAADPNDPSMFFTINNDTNPRMSIGNSVNILVPLSIDGDLEIDGDLDVSGTFSIGDDITFAEDGNGGLNINIANGQNVTINENLRVDQGLTVDNNSVFSADVEVRGNIVMGSNVNIDANSGNLNLNVDTGNNVAVNENLTVGGNLTVSGTATLADADTDTLDVTNNATVGGTLSVVGLSDLAGVTADSLESTGTLTVTGTGATNLGGTLNVAGLSDLAGVTADSLESTGTLTVTGTGATNLGGTLDVIGLSTLANTGIRGTLILENTTTLVKDTDDNFSISTTPGNQTAANNGNITLNSGGMGDIILNAGNQIILGDPFRAVSTGVIERQLTVGDTNLLIGFVNNNQPIPTIADFFGVVSIGNQSTQGYRRGQNFVNMLEVNGEAFKTTGTSAWTVPSDSRVKTNDGAFTDGLNKLRNVNPVRFTFNGLAQTPEDISGIGVIAQDIENDFDYMIRPFNRKLNPGDAAETEILGVNDSAFTYVLINAVKDLDQLREDLADIVSANHTQNNSDISALTSALNALSSRVAQLETHH